MIEEAQTLKKLSKALSLHLMAVQGATGLFYSLASLLLSLLFIEAVDYFLFLPYFVRLTLLGLASIFFLFLLSKNFLLPLLKPPTEVELNSLLKRKYPNLKDNFINALELSRAENKNVSFSLIKLLIKEMAKESQKVKGEEIVNKNSFRKSSLLLVNASLLFFSLSLMPTSPLSFNLARLFVGNLGVQSRPISPQDVISPTQLADLKVEYSYPAYTGLSKKSLADFSGRIEALAGTEVRLSFSSNHSLSSASLFLEKKEIPISPKDLTTRFILSGSGQYQIKAKDIFYREAEGIAGYYFSSSDEAPRIRILSPTTDLRSTRDGELHIKAEAEDDFGLGEILLSYEARQTKGRKEILIRRFPGQKKTLFSYNWDLSPCGFKEGERVRFYLEALDNDSISGPKKGQSLSYQIEIFSASKEHEEVKKDMEALEKELLSLFMEQKVTQGRFKNAVDWLKIDRKKGIDLLREVNERQDNLLQSRTSRLSDQARDLAERMLADPLEDYLNYTDTSHIKEGLISLSSKKMPEAIHALSKIREGREESLLNKESRLQEEMVKDLEELWSLAKEVRARQKERDLYATASNVSENYLDFLRDLQEAKSGFDQKKEALLRELAKLGSLLNQLASQLQSLLTKLPKVKASPNSCQLDLDQMNNSFNQLAKSLNSGDLESALKEAANLAKAISSLKKALSSLAKSCPSSSSASLCQKGSELTNRLEEIVKREESLRDKTLPLEEKRRKLFDERAEQVLAKIREKGEEALKKTEKLIYNKKIGGEALILKESFLKMYGEAKGGSLRQSRELSREIDRSLQRALETVKDEDILSLLNELKGIKGEIDQGLNLDEEDLFNLPEKKSLEELCKEQEGIEMVTKKLIEEVEGFSKKSSLLEPEMTKDLKMACEAMGEAKESLLRFRSKQALEKEEEALHYLTKSYENLSQSMCQLGQQVGLSLGARPQPQPGQAKNPGQFGLREGYVEIPKKEEPLRRGGFQKEILKGVKEKFIKDYENLIEFYYKRLTE